MRYGREQHVRILRTPAVIRDHNAVNIVLVGQNSVFDGLNTLDHERKIGDLADPRDGVPVQIRRDGTREGFGDALDWLATAADLFVLFTELQCPYISYTCVTVARKGGDFHTSTWAFSRSSRSRLPVTGESTVSQMPCTPALMARRMVCSEIFASLCMYSC
jgi:hypothetical protein